LYAETVYTNDLGNSVRDDVVMIKDEEGNATYTYEPTSGGVVLDGVYAPGTTLNINGVVTDVSGQKNFTRAPGNDYRLQGYSKNPNSTFVYAASYIKLREAVITYSIPRSILSKSFFNGVSFSLVGSNLWIIAKELPHADPEASQSSGNIQGWQSGVMPTTRNVGFSVNLQF
jgi:hypothetical protein